MPNTERMGSAMRPVRAVTLSLLHRLFAGLAAELSPERSPGPLLVIAPHADDETLGCGATIMRARQAGRHVAVVVISDGSRSVISAAVTPERLADIRRQETLAATAVLGVDSGDVSFLRFPDASLREHIGGIAGALRPLIERLRPSQILAPYGIDGHADHRAVSAAVGLLIASGAVDVAVYEYPIWFWPRRAIRHLSMPGQLARLRRVSTAGLLPRKRQAMEAYRSQLENFTGEAGAWFLTEAILRDFYTPQELFFQRT